MRIEDYKIGDVVRVTLLDDHPQGPIVATGVGFDRPYVDVALGPTHPGIGKDASFRVWVPEWLEIVVPPEPKVPDVKRMWDMIGLEAGVPVLVPPDQITKQDTGKPDWTLILGPLQNALLACVRVREYGEIKYRAIAKKAGVPFDPESWRKNAPERYIKSAQRHLMAVIKGERINHEDGGVEHIAQAMIDLAFAYETELSNTASCASGDTK